MGKKRYNAEEATQFILDLPSDSDMSDLSDFSEYENTNVCNQNSEHHSDTEIFGILKTC